MLSATSQSVFLTSRRHKLLVVIVGISNMAKAKDEEMKDAEPASTKASTSETDVTPEADARLSPTDQLAANLAVLEKAVSLKETRMISGRLLRQTAAIRHQLTPQILSDFVTKALPEDATMKPVLLKQLKQVACL